MSLVRTRPPAPARLALVLAALVAAGGEAGAQERRGEPRLTDSIEVVVLPRSVLAVGAGNGSVSESLELTERVRSTRSRGDVAIVITDRRILTVGVESSQWSETRIRLGERPDVDVRIGQRIGLLTTSQRLLGFGVPRGGQLVERSIGPNESLLAQRVGDAVAVVVTNRDALGLSAEGGGFVPADLRIHESVESVSVRARSATVRTSQRVLVFDGRSVTWSEESIPID